MTDYTAPLLHAAPSVAPLRRPATRLPAGVARPVLAHAVLLGVAGDALLRDGPTGIGFSVWIALCAIALTSLVLRAGRPLPAETRLWLTVATVFAAGMAWRASEVVRVLDALAACGALALAAVTLSGNGTPVLVSRLREAASHAITPALAVMKGILPLALRELFAPEVRGSWMPRARPFLRAALISSALLGVFGTLLSGADPIFASLVSLPAIDLQSLLSHAVLIGIFAWLTGGLAIGSLQEPADEPWQLTGLPASLGMTDVTTALVTLNALFTVFVLVQLGWLFGGEQFLRARTGLTAAEYARQGFFQMVWVVVLVLPLLVAIRALLAPGSPLLRRYTLLAIPVVVLVGAIIVSAAMRMKLYVHYYGLTLDRFNTLVFMAWLGFVLVWLAMTVLQGRERLFLAGALSSALVALAALNVIAPDAVVARVNASRVRTAIGRPVDLTHLARLGGEGVPWAVHAVVAPGNTDPADRCTAARTLLSKWGPTSAAAAQPQRDVSWRTWNAGERSAVRLVGAHSAALRTVMHENCPARRSGQR